MPAPADQPRSPFTILIVLLLFAALAVSLLEYWTQGLLAQSAAEGGVDPAMAPLAKLANAYLDMRAHVFRHPVRYFVIAPMVPVALYVGLRRLAHGANQWRERFAGMDFKQSNYEMAHPFGATPDPVAATQHAFIDKLFDNPEPERQVVLGFDEDAKPVYLSDRARSMHLHLLGQTGSGKTQSVLYQLLYQDARRRWNEPGTGAKRARPLVFLDAKGSAENEDTIAAVAAATGRLDSLWIFTLNHLRPTHTYNPLYIGAQGDPRQVAERVFSTFEGDLDVQYYKDMARELWVNLVCALASTGKQSTMLDAAAAIADPEIMAHALSLASDRKAVTAIQSRYAQLGDRQGMTYTGLLAAVNRYDHAALNTYDPDIVLEDIVEQGGMVSFSLSANAYKFQARAVGLILLQHLQHIGAMRQMNRNLSQAPLYVYADEFYTFAYEGFVDAVNKLRDANVSLCLSHQSLSDLDRVSPEYATAVWDNTRNKIVLYQSDPAMCDRLAASVGTYKNNELTVRRSVDGFLNQASALEASSKEVDEFILHPNKLKSLRPGQAYLVQAGTADAAPVRGRWPWSRPAPAPASQVAALNLALFKALPPAKPQPPKTPSDANGIGLHALFLDRRSEKAS